MSFEMKFSLAKSYPAGQPAKKLVSGIYKGRIGKVEGKNEGTRAMFVIEVTEDPLMAGLTAVTSMRIPTSSDDKVLYYWRALAESCGYSREEIEKIESWNDKHFLGRECYFEYTEPNKRTQTYAEVKWLVPSLVEIARKRFEASRKNEAG